MNLFLNGLFQGRRERESEGEGAPEEGGGVEVDIVWADIFLMKKLLKFPALINIQVILGSSH